MKNPAPSALPAVLRIYGHLSVYGQAPDTCQVRYVGYPLLLSPCETQILLRLLDAPERDRGCVEVCELEACLSGYDAVPDGESEDDNRPSEARTFIRRINRKAREIGGRDLIVRDRHRGYRLNPHM